MDAVKQYNDSGPCHGNDTDNQMRVPAPVRTVLFASRLLRCAALCCDAMRCTPPCSRRLAILSLPSPLRVLPCNFQLPPYCSPKSQQSILQRWLALGNSSFTLIRSAKQASPRSLGAGSLVLFCFNFIWEMPGDSACQVPLLALLFVDAGPNWNRTNFATFEGERRGC